MIEIQILTTPNCPGCEEAKKVIEKVKKDFDISVEIIDVIQKPEFALKYTLLSAPGIVINGKLEFVGGVSEKELRKKLEEAG